MNKATKIGYLLTISIIILLLCAPITPSITGEKNKIVKNDIIKIGIKEATLVSEMKLQEMKKTEGYSIDSCEEIFEENRLICYIFNLKPQGFIIVTSDFNLPPIIAYSFTNNYLISDSEESILNLLKADIKNRIENIQNLPENKIHNRNQLWMKYLNRDNENILKMDFQQWPPEGTTTTEGWVETNWNQNAPYNALCPITLPSSDRSYAGCPAVTMAQILNYHETTNNIVFDDGDDYYHNFYDKYWIDDDYLIYDFPSFPQLNGYFDTLLDHYENNITLTNDDIAALIFGCGVACEQIYHSSGSGTLSVDQAYDAYLRFDFEDIDLLDDDDPDLYEQVSNNIKDALPVHLAVVNPTWTAGHNLVIDGYNTDDYYHLNFGWGGAYDGWYILPDEMPYDLTVIEGIIVDIYPPIPTTVFVDDDYNETTVGWQEDHFDIIQDGIDNVADNGYVIVYNGSYFENIEINKPLSLIGEDKDTTTINGGFNCDVIKIGANRVNVSGFTIENGGDGSCFTGGGIWIYQANYSYISDNIIISNQYNGVSLTEAHNNSIINNTISDNGIGVPSNALSLFFSNDNQIYGNLVDSNNDQGIWLYHSHWNNISNNVISNNVNDGISIYYSSDRNQIYGNNISNNRYGVYLSGTNKYNRVYHNNFIENTNNSYDDHINTFWDDGYPSGGNFWDDYEGYDSNGDGIGETPYDIDGPVRGVNKDWFPLINLWNGTEPQPICGDADGSGDVDIDDVVFLINYIFSGGPGPIPSTCVGDADASGGADIDDVVYLISYIFSGGPSPTGCCE